MSKINVHPDHLRKSGGKLKDFGGQIEQTGSKLEETGQNLVSHASGDRSGIGSVVAKAMGRGVEVTGKVFKEGGRVAGSAGGRLGNSADLFEEADSTGASGLKKIHNDGKSKSVTGGSSRSGSSVSASGGSGKKAKSVAGGSSRSGSSVGSGGGGKDHSAPAIPGGGGEPTRLSGDLPDPHSASAQLPGLLERHGMTQDEFDSMRHRMNQPGGTANVSHDEALKWRALREDIPLENGTPVQKVLNPWAAQHYLDNSTDDKFDPTVSRGCFARVSDAGQMHTPAQNYEGLRLDYSGTPFTPGDQSVHVLRTTAEPGNYSVPFGGPTEEGRANIGGTNVWGEPYTGNGFTGSDKYLVPEWDRQESPLRNGDTIHELYADGTSRQVAHYIDGVGWIKEDQ
ncbi:hypothetical protein [Kutzneria sp. CA-103260]|uniref:hypothetical protein n=1 Tax=Kutzneria sp. CA-103260 TaxID=2802641 RepID=UPI001BA93433|nr:hypothetical protein [Kutzneria sp. CA-103260]QUQ69782.1 hypothetical protein JJ691_75440 [Kutzneria sp. CA-103260]